MIDLFDALCAIPYVKIATATKILHKKRPALIPIIDSVIADYLVGCREIPVPKGSTLGYCIVDCMRIFRRQLLCHYDAIQALCQMAAQELCPITPVRALEILLWIHCEPRGGYRQ